MMKSTIAALIVAGASACANEWIWEECSWMYYRYPCADEYIHGDDGDGCGWFYWDDWNLEEFEVTCGEVEDWSWCWDD